MNLLSDFKKELKNLPKAEKGRFLKDLHLEKENTKTLAQSLGLGVFIGFTPTVGVQTILCYLLARIFKKNFLAIFLGSCLPVGTPIQIPFTYLLCFKLGSYILRKNITTIPNFKGLSVWRLFSYLRQDAIPSLLIGSIIIGTLAAICIYFLSLWLISKQRRNNYIYA